MPPGSVLWRPHRGWGQRICFVGLYAGHNPNGCASPKCKGPTKYRFGDHPPQFCFLLPLVAVRSFVFFIHGRLAEGATGQRFRGGDSQGNQGMVPEIPCPTESSAHVFLTLLANVLVRCNRRKKNSNTFMKNDIEAATTLGVSTTPRHLPQPRRP